MAKQTYWKITGDGRLPITEHEYAARDILKGRVPRKSTGGNNPPPPPPPSNRSYALADPPERKQNYSVRDAPRKSPDLYTISKGLETGKNMYRKIKDDETLDTTIQVTQSNLSSVGDALRSAVKNGYQASVIISYPSIASDEDNQIAALIDGKKRPIRMRSVISSNVRRIGFDSVDDTVYVQFKRMGSSVYYYEGGGIDLYQNLITAPSHGHAIWEWIRWMGNPYPYGVTSTPLESDAYFVFG